MKASNADESKWYVHGEQCGVLSRRGVTSSLTMSSGVVAKLKPDDELREPMGQNKALEMLRNLSKGGTATDVVRSEIGAVLRLSQRAMGRIIERGTESTERVEGPEEFKEHDYMGSFTVGDQILVGDSGSIADPAKMLAVTAEPGTWHVYVRHMPVALDVPLAVFAVHESYLAAATEDGEELGVFVVEGSAAVVIDSTGRDADRFATGASKGTYAARCFRKSGRAIVVRASVSKPEFSYFSMPAAKVAPTKKYAASLAKRTAGAGEARTYSIKETFEVGDLVTHPKFGDGMVSAVLADGKVTIDFADGARTLIHARV